MNKVSHRKNIILIVFEGIAAAIILNLYNPYMQMFAKRMGAHDFYVALINSLPQLVAILILIPCSVFVERIRNKKKVVCALIVINSIFYIIIAFVPFLPQSARLLAYVVFIGLMNWPASLYTTTWQSFFSYTFHSGEASRVYSARSRFAAFFGLITVLVTGFVLTALPKNDDDRILLYQLFYGICFLVSMIQVVLLSKVRQTGQSALQSMDGEKSFFSKSAFKEVFANKKFMIYCGCIFAFYFTWQMGWPIFFLYNADVIKANEFQMGLINVASGLSSFISYPIWNKLMAKKDKSFIIILGALGLAVNPFFYVTKVHLYTVIAINLFVGAAAAGFTLTVFCHLLELLPETKKTLYISVFNTFINISGFAAPLVGVWLNGHVGIFAAFFIIAILRLLAVGLLTWRWNDENKGKSGVIHAEL